MHLNVNERDIIKQLNAIYGCCVQSNQFGFAGILSFILFDIRRYSVESSVGRNVIFVKSYHHFIFFPLQHLILCFLPICLWLRSLWNTTYPLIPFEVIISYILFQYQFACYLFNGKMLNNSSKFSNILNNEHGGNKDFVMVIQWNLPTFRTFSL